MKQLAEALRAQARTLVALADAIEADGGESPPVPEWVPLIAAAKLANVSTRTLKDAARAGKIDTSGTSRTRVVSRASLLAWIESRRVSRPDPDDELVRRAEEIATIGSEA